MANNEQKAVQLISEAERKLSSVKSFFESLFGGSTKLEDAAERYQRAGNLFKMSKNWNQAGNAFSKAAMLYSKGGSRHETANNYVEAANCYRKSDFHEAIDCLKKAIDIYTDMGRFIMAAKYHKNIAEIFEIDAADLTSAIKHYKQAADYYRGEESISSSNNCFLKVAHHAAQLQDYETAISIYQQVAASCLNNSLLKYNAREYLFRAALCELCVDVLSTQHALARYELMYPLFQDSRECKLVKKLIKYIEEEDVEGYTDTVQEYDMISRLDQWYITMLLRIKKRISDNPDLR